MVDPNTDLSLLGRLRAVLVYRLGLKEDQAEVVEIDRRLREGVEFRGTNAWLLIIAIFIASVGLNVNSTAVIIGAMLISPLMGPIMGIGYGVGVNDFVLIRRSFRALSVAVILSLITSTVYFALSPLTEAQSELLGRTSPTLWDVIIALMGGLAGAIGATRKEKSNVIPGVAIATALMPPLCAAGYGLAHGNPFFFLGAFYLFFINSVFIAISTVAVTKILKLPIHHASTEAVQSRMRRYVYAVVVLTMLPSVYLTWNLVRAELFRAHAREFLANEMEMEGAHQTDVRIDPKTRVIELTLLGRQLQPATLLGIEKRLPRYGLEDAKLRVHDLGDEKVDVATLKAGLLSDLYKESQQNNEEKDRKIESLRLQVAKKVEDCAAQQQEAGARAAAAQQALLAQLEQLHDAQTGRAQLHAALARELAAQLPNAGTVTIAEAEVWLPKAATSTTALLVRVESAVVVAQPERDQLRAWLGVRTGLPHILFEVVLPAGILPKEPLPRAR